MPASDQERNSRWASPRRLRSLHGLPLDAADDARFLDRGARSGVGIGLFETGGLVVDGGRAPRSAAPPIVSRMRTFPRPGRSSSSSIPRAKAFTARRSAPLFDRSSRCRRRRGGHLPVRF